MSVIDLDSDLAFARQLQQQFDKELIELSSGEEDNTDADYQLAVSLQQRFNAEAVEVSDDENDDVHLLGVEIPASASNVKEESSDESEQSRPSRPNRTDLNPDEFFIEELQTYVDPDNNFEWKFIEVATNIQSIFERLDELYFQSRFKPKNFNIIWSQAIGKDCTNRNFNDCEGRYTIALNEHLLRLRPRIEVISVLMHEMIHAYLKMEGVKENNNGHGPNFRKIMLFLNQMLQTNISFNHRLINANPICRTQWYRCTGICHNYKPFYGIVRSVEGPPGLQNEWWRAHQDNCGGTFFKVYEMNRIEDGEIFTRFAVNVRYMVPKRENIRGRHKSHLSPKESIDLTSDSPIIISTIPETVALDDDGPTVQDTKSADKFIQNFHRAVAFTRDSCEMQCPICQERVKRKLFSNHIDGCKGIVQQIRLKRRGGGMIVQNGMEETRASLQNDQHLSNGAGPSNGYNSSIANYQRIKRQRFF